MTFLDLFKMSLDNLLRRKLRTVLTVLGVIIGTASIVVMLSLGLGLKRSCLKQIEQYGGITTVNVYASEGQLDEKGQQKEVKRLDDKLVTQIAQIGIANTMMMSIYERTKEIGILKVLGCELSDIRKMFLMEAGFIGFAGGFTGLLLSFCISAIINTVAKNSAYQGISCIPLWLVAMAQIFSVLMGMIAGLIPALRAMRLSPLMALRNE